MTSIGHCLQLRRSTWRGFRCHDACMEARAERAATVTLVFEVAYIAIDSL